MTKVEVNPGICGFIANITAELNDDEECVVTVESGCGAIMGMMAELGDTFDGMEVCLKKPGQTLFHDYAAEHFPVRL